MGFVRGCLGALTRAVSGLLALLVVVWLPLSVLAFDLGRVVFSPERMAALVSDSLDEVGGLRRLTMEAITRSEGDTPQGGLSLKAALSFLTPQERDYLAERLLPPDWAREQLRSGLNDIYAWIDNDLARPNVVIDLRPVKETLRQGGADELIEVVVDSWPPCTVDQVAAMAGQLFGLGDKFLFCEPPEPLRTGVVAMAGEAIKLSLYALPDRLSVSGGTSDRPAEPKILELKQNIRRVRALSRWGWLLLPVLLGGLLALAIRNWRSWAWWWGLPTILGGLLTLASTVGVRLAARAIVQGMASEPGQPPILADLFRAVADGWVTQTVRAVAVHGALVLLGGGVVFAIGMILGRRIRPLAKPPAPPGTPEAGILALSVEPEPREGEHPSGMFG